MVNTLVEELSHFINEYSTAVRGAGETQEWHLVLQEITLFLQADMTASYKNLDWHAAPRRSVFANRVLTPPKLDASASSTLSMHSSTGSVMNGIQILKLQSCILVGSHQHQVKFSELTLDMYRMMYCLEKEPSHSHHFPAIHYGPVNPSTVGTGPGGTNLHEPAPASVDGPPAASIALGASANGISAKVTTNEPSATAIGNNGQQTTPSKSSRSKNANANPKKYLLYRPTVSQVLLYLASAQRELLDNSVLLLYLSADGEPSKTPSSSSSTPINSVPPVSPASISTSSSSVPPSPMASSLLLNTSQSMHSSTSSLPSFSQLLSNISASSSSNSAVYPDLYSCGGLKLKREEFASKTAVARASPFVNPCAFYPADIAPFTRRPTFIIVDSDYSHSFLNIGTPFGSALLVLASPQETPIDVIEGSQAGGLFTFYLHDPLSAFLFTANKTITNHTLFEQAHVKVKAITSALDDLIGSSSDLRTLLLFPCSCASIGRCFYVCRVTPSHPHNC